MLYRKPCGHLGAQGLARDEYLVCTDCINEVQHEIDIVLRSIIEIRHIGIAVSDHIDSHDPKMFGVLFDVTQISLGMTAGAMQKNQYWPFSRLYDSGVYAACIDVSLLKWDPL